MFVFVKVRVFKPGVVRLDAVSAKIGVEADCTFTEVVKSVLSGVVILIEKTWLSDCAGRERVNDVAEAPTTTGWTKLFPEVNFSMKLLLGQDEGNPLPVNVTFAPLVDIDEGVTPVIEAVCLSKKPLVSPIGSILTLTL